MKIRIISSKEEIPTVTQNETIIHMAFRPSSKDLFQLVKTCPKMEVLQLPKSYRQTISKSMEVFFEMQKIRLIEGELTGFRKDVNESMDLSKIEERITVQKIECQPVENIKRRVYKETKVSEEMADYLVDKIKI